jgi:integrase
MTARILTARTVELARPARNAAGESVRTEFPDSACPGLRLIVQPTGTKSWALRYRRPDGTTAKHTLGDASADGLTLAAARAKAATARLRREQGEDPAPKRLPVETYSSGSAVTAAIAQFLELHAARKTRPATAAQYTRILNGIALPRWRNRSVDSIKRREIIELIDWVALDRPVLANRAAAVLAKFFAWCVNRDLISTSPAVRIERPHKEKARERTLSDDELRAIWLACEAIADPFARAVQVMILTGARRNEASHMQQSEIVGSEWVIPGERVKNGHTHVVPLSEQMRIILRSMPRLQGCDHVFTTHGSVPIRDWARAKARISAAANIPESSWRLHDVRRTCASGMQRLGVPVHVIEKALNHVSGTFRGIVGTYQTHDYPDEVANAFQAWGDHVERLATGKIKVVKLRRN